MPLIEVMVSDRARAAGLNVSSNVAIVAGTRQLAFYGGRIHSAAEMKALLIQEGRRVGVSPVHPGRGM